MLENRNNAAIAPAVERTLGKGEVACSNHAGSTIFLAPTPHSSTYENWHLLCLVKPIASLSARNACNKAAGQLCGNQNCRKGNIPALIPRRRPQRGAIIRKTGRVQRCHTRYHKRHYDGQKKLNHSGAHLAGVISLKNPFPK